MWKSKRNCKECGSPFHAAWYHKPRKPLQTHTQLKPKKRMRKVGKIGRKLIEQSQRFREEHPGPQKCFYCLYTGIDQLIDDYNVEHPYSKARHPDMRFDYDKLIVSCPAHNEQKKSLDIEQFLEKLDKELQNARKQHNT
jgi:hypothetical protein